MQKLCAEHWEMHAMATASQVLYTAEEFARRPDPGYPEELVRGKIVSMPVPKPRDGQV
jgi:hypothetical protein